MQKDALGFESGEAASIVLRRIIEWCQAESLVGVLSRRLECSTATVYNWRETVSDEKALQRLLRISLLQDHDLENPASVARHAVAERVSR